MPVPAGDGLYTEDSVREFFGNMPGDSRAVLMLPSDWRHYCEAWPSIPQHLKDLGIGRFWASQEVRSIAGFRDPLAQLGRWYANTPTNNVHGGATLRR